MFIHVCRTVIKKVTELYLRQNSFQELWKAVVTYDSHAHGKDVTIQQELCCNLLPLEPSYRGRDTNGIRQSLCLVPGKGRQSTISRFALFMGIICIWFPIWRKICCLLLYLCCGWPVKQTHKYAWTHLSFQLLLCLERSNHILVQVTF